MRQESYEALGYIEGGALKMYEREHMLAAMKRFPDGAVVVSVRTNRPTRSSRQNRYWHGVVIPAFAEHCGYDFDDMKDALALKLLPREIVDPATGEVNIVPGHTAQLTTTQFNELVERAQRFGAEMGVYIPDPGEVSNLR